jgi:hypothetical protein
MRDSHVDPRAELSALSLPPKPRGRKPTRPNGAMTPAQRKAEQRSRQATAINERDSHEWTEAECLLVLAGKTWRGTVIDRQAWLRIGQLRGYT